MSNKKTALALLAMHVAFAPESITPYDLSSISSPTRTFCKTKEESKRISARRKKNKQAKKSRQRNRK
jgi:hypothetical protein